MELQGVVDQVARANNIELSAQEVVQIGEQWVREFGDKGGVTVANFQRYVVSRPDIFGPMLRWRVIFDCYSDQDMILAHHAVELVRDMYKCMGAQCTEDAVQKMARDLVSASDKDGKGFIDFVEFVRLAEGHQEWQAGFKALREEVLNPRNMCLDEDELASRLFREEDTNRDGVLDGNELVRILRKLAQANHRFVSKHELQQEASACLQQFGGQKGAVNLENFKRYAASRPSLFGPLYQWREVFNKYKSSDGEMRAAQAFKLVMDVCLSNGTSIDEAQAQAEALEMMKAADADGSGSISFGEFVTYAKSKEDLFGKIKERILSPYMSPRKGLPPSLDEEELSASLFAEADANGNGTLDAGELVPVLRKLAAAAGIRLASNALEIEADKCLREFASDPGGVRLQDFRRYAASRPDLFGPLYQWREVFNKYKSSDGEMRAAEAFKLVMDVCRSNGTPIDEARAQAEALEMMKAADADGSGSISFGEFVMYAHEHAELFSKSFFLALALAHTHTLLLFLPLRIHTASPNTMWSCLVGAS